MTKKTKPITIVTEKKNPKPKSKEIETKDLTKPYVVIGGEVLEVDSVDNNGHSVFKTKLEDKELKFILCPKSSLEVRGLLKPTIKTWPASKFHNVVTNTLLESDVKLKFLGGSNKITNSSIDTDTLVDSTVTGSNIKEGSQVRESVITDSTLETCEVSDSYITKSVLNDPDHWRVIKSCLFKVNYSGHFCEPRRAGFSITVLGSKLKEVNIYLATKIHQMNVIAFTKLSNIHIDRSDVSPTEFLEGGVNVLAILSPFDVLNVSLTNDTKLVMTKMVNDAFVVTFGCHGMPLKLTHEIIEEGVVAVRKAVEETTWGRNHLAKGAFGRSLVNHAVQIILSRIRVSKAVQDSVNNLNYLNIPTSALSAYGYNGDHGMESVTGYGPSAIPF